MSVNLENMDKEYSVKKVRLKMKESLATKTYKRIYNDIYVKKKYTPNDFIVEQEIADDYGVSKGTASEALHRLCMEGHIISFPRKGYQVAVVSQEEARQAQRLRFVVESLVMHIIVNDVSKEKLQTFYEKTCGSSYNISGEPSLNVERGGNDNFHLDLAKLTEDHYVIDALDRLLATINRVTMYMAMQPSQIDTAVNHHRAIVKALLQGEEKVAVQHLKEDLEALLLFE